MELTQYNQFVDELESEWNVLLAQSAVHVPFLRYEYLRTWWQTRGGGEWPEAELMLITARENGQLVAAAPLFKTVHEGQPSLLLVGSIAISDYLDLLAKPGYLAPFLEALLALFSSEQFADIQHLDLYNLLDSSPSLLTLEQAAQSAGWNYQQERLEHSPYIPLPGDWETYLSGIDKKQRHEIRRKMRRAEEAEAEIRWYTTTDPFLLDQDLNAFMDLMVQDPEKATFLTEPMRRQFTLAAHNAFDRRYLHLSFLEINGEKAAAYLSFDYLDRLWVYNSGLDRQFNEYSPGWVLLGHLLRWANEQKHTEFDFMRGNEEYKYRFGAIDRFVMRAKLSKRN